MGFIDSLVNFFASTGIVEQLSDVNYKALFTNPWFMVPFVGFIGYNLYKQAVNILVITALAIGLWLFSGSPLMEGLTVNGELQLGKILPVAGVIISAIGVAIYFLFMRE